MNRNSRVSAIIIFLNAGKFIREAIESVFAQTYDNWELLLVDDGSTDDSTNIALQYTKRYPEKVRYLEHADHQNCGMSPSRNLGIRNARGEYIALLDADDVWLPHKLEQQVAIMVSQPEAGMIYGRTQYWYSWTGNTCDIQRDYIPEFRIRPNTLIRPPRLITLSYPLGNDTTPCSSDLMFRRELAVSIGGFEESFRGKYQMYEDRAFLTKVYLRSPVFFADECWDRYRQHSDSCVHVIKKAGQYHAVRLFFLNWLFEYLSKQGVADKEVWKSFEKAIWQYRHPILHRLRSCVKYLVKDKGELLKKMAGLQLPVQR